MILGSWPLFWLFVLSVGVVSALLLWFIGGWWYNLRIRWSGAGAHEERAGRLVYVFSGFVVALPVFAYTAIATGLYDNYGAAWIALGNWSLLFLVFPFWSVLVSYLGVCTQFPVSIRGARLWFLILPIAVEILALGILGLAIRLLSGSQTGVAA